MNAAHAPIFDFLVHIMLVRRSKTLIFLYFQKLRYLTSFQGCSIVRIAGQN